MIGPPTLVWGKSFAERKAIMIFLRIREVYGGEAPVWLAATCDESEIR
jgi:hypothetical protein